MVVFFYFLTIKLRFYSQKRGDFFALFFIFNENFENRLKMKVSVQRYARKDWSEWQIELKKQ